MPVLCATDLSDAAGEAADVAAELAARLGQPLSLIHCAAEWVVSRDFMVTETDDNVLHLALDAEAARLRAVGIEVTTEMRHGIPSQVILEHAKKLSPSFLVMGSSGKGLAERWRIGRVAERVAEGAPVPTLVVRKAKPLLSWLRGESDLRLLYGVDLTASADTAIMASRPLIRLGRAEVEAVSVRTKENLDFSKDPTTRQLDVWERITEMLGDVPKRVHVRDEDASAAEEFLETADERAPGLLVVGTHQRAEWKQRKRASFSRDVLMDAVTNVLCVPAIAVTEPHIPRIRRVLLATNFTGVCLEAYRYAHSLLPEGGAIHLIHVCPDSNRGLTPLVLSPIAFDHTLGLKEAKEEAAAKLKALPSALLTKPGVAITWEVVVHDEVAAAICETAQRVGADVICLGTKGHSRAGVALLGSTVQEVLSQTHIPVLAVTPPLP